VSARSLRLIVDAPAAAAWNMAVDEALLELAAKPTLRLYGWSPHAVSLGWFQRAADFADLPAGTPVVRRLTGGGAIHHGDELTFSLVVAADMLPRDVAASYARIHDAALRALAECGVTARRLTTGAGPGARPAARWCFAEPGRDDVVTAAGKLLGSAQRRVQRPSPRVLHHGSLVLRRPSLTPFAAAVADTPGADVARLPAAFVRHVSLALDLEPVAGGLTDAERALAVHLRAQRHDDPAFLHRR
jgi:lipoate-protein ligase A